MSAYLFKCWIGTGESSPVCRAVLDVFGSHLQCLNQSGLSAQLSGRRCQQPLTNYYSCNGIRFYAQLNLKYLQPRSSLFSPTEVSDCTALQGVLDICFKNCIFHQPNNDVTVITETVLFIILVSSLCILACCCYDNRSIFKYLCRADDNGPAARLLASS